MKKRILITAYILTIVGIVLFIASLPFSVSSFNRFRDDEYETNEYVFNESFDNIKIQVKETDITIKPSENGEFRAEINESKKVKHEVSISDETLNITVADNRKWIDRLTLFHRTPTITLYLPIAEYEKAEIVLSTGDLNILSGLKFKDMEIELSTGEATLECAVENDLNIEVGTGKIKVKSVNCKNVNLGASTGDITLDGVVAEEKLAVKTSTGDVKLKNCDGEEIKISTSTGDVTGTILTPKTYTCKTPTGKVSVPENEAGGKCEITTGTGDIKIKLSIE